VGKEKIIFASDTHFRLLEPYAKADVHNSWMVYMQVTKNRILTTGDIEESKPIDYTPYFRVEGYKRRGKGTVYRVVRIRDELVIHRLVKSKERAEQSARLMVETEKITVEKEIERTILG